MNAYGAAMPGAGGPGGVSQAEAAQIMQQEAQFYIDFVNKVTDACFKKCVAKFNEGDLNTGEQACVDRCVSKYFDVSLARAAHARSCRDTSGSEGVRRAVTVGSSPVIAMFISEAREVRF
ncbi:Mitochondrial import inner membrane translocase subunit tim10 [Porphyridium purpureum]|uniref:Mitochondrial import inner membrane translocase subunit n=1 Tax=Porphyridium purpureum TaxID=35688 RepID=A0A5J4YVG9_PORPP|nr:Mitochondrial import inner membrane translocase subunit tim10 [Porphyridium purpureum]|eukprot:POR9218..scf227_4